MARTRHAGLWGPLAVALFAGTMCSGETLLLDFDGFQPGATVGGQALDGFSFEAEGARFVPWDSGIVVQDPTLAFGAGLSASMAASAAASASASAAASASFSASEQLSIGAADRLNQLTLFGTALCAPLAASTDGCLTQTAILLSYDLLQQGATSGGSDGGSSEGLDKTDVPGKVDGSVKKASDGTIGTVGKAVSQPDATLESAAKKVVPDDLEDRSVAKKPRDPVSKTGDSDKLVEKATDGESSPAKKLIDFAGLDAVTKAVSDDDLKALEKLQTGGTSGATEPFFSIAPGQDAFFEFLAFELTGLGSFTVSATASDGVEYSTGIWLSSLYGGSFAFWNGGLITAADLGLDGLTLSSLTVSYGGCGSDLVSAGLFSASSASASNCSNGIFFPSLPDIDLTAGLAAGAGAIAGAGAGAGVSASISASLSASLNLSNSVAQQASALFQTPTLIIDNVALRRVPAPEGPPAAPIPLPPTALLLGSALLATAGWSRRTARRAS